MTSITYASETRQDYYGVVALTYTANATLLRPCNTRANTNGPCSQAVRKSDRSPTRLVAQLCYMRRINCPKRERRGSDQNSRHRTGGTA